MSEERKKLTLYLHPEVEADKQTMKVIETVSRSGRGELFRNAFIAGMALQQLDSRLPALVATLLTDKLTADQLVGLVSQTTGWKPSQADIRDILAELGSGQPPNPRVEKNDVEAEALDTARKKLSSFL